MIGNKLIDETSPYLLQHAYQPVEWYPWGEEAFSKARQEDKPILLSIGYSACHWCHVMAHESFEDEETAAWMNRYFVNIKIDREERPDLDKIYQLTHQVMTHRSGGWPLTVFLHPHSHLPFFSGTYFPKIARFHLPSFTTLLRHLSEYYKNNQKEVLEYNSVISHFLDSLVYSKKSEGADTLLSSARKELEADFDKLNGGFGHAPKFPQTTCLEFFFTCLRQSGYSDKTALTIITVSLHKMAEGGIFDHIGGGFYRYAVDAQWHIPHFEKMLYDNALLLKLYSMAFHVTGYELFREVAEATAQWLIYEMSSDNGGFYAALDADSEEEEGKYYVWDRNVVNHLLTEEEYAVVEQRFNFPRGPNFEGYWHLHAERSIAAVADMLEISVEKAEKDLCSAKHALYRERSTRIPPFLDKKIVTAWNALMIEGLAAAGRILSKPDWISLAERTFYSIQRDHTFDSERLLAVRSGGKRPVMGYLDDYAFLLSAGLQLLQCRWSTTDLIWLQKCADYLLENFEDPIHGGFFFTEAKHEKLIHRLKSFTDDSLPSGNGIALLTLIRLGRLLQEERYTRSAERALQTAVPVLEESPRGCSTLLIALAEWRHPPEYIIIRGNKSDLPEWIHASRTYCADRLIFAISNEEKNLPEALSRYSSQDRPVAYLCTGESCRPPIYSLEDFHHAMMQPIK